ncbi:hypothetical protein [Phycicoccus ginsengisoli]
MAHLHEIHHKVLNDDTSWGTLVHVVARHPEWAATLLRPLVDACRLVHESFASFMSVSLARTRHPDVDQVLDRYPAYQPLARRLGRMLARVPEGHRVDLAATAVARWAMSAPVMDLALSAFPETLSLADLPATWRPDHRLRLLQRHCSDDIVLAAVGSADSAFKSEHGLGVDDLGMDATDASLDRAWETWEYAFITAVLAADPVLAGIATAGPNDHLAPADALITALAGAGVDVALPHAVEEAALTDAESVHRLTAASSVRLRHPYAGALATMVADVNPDDVLNLCAASATPYVVVHARRRTQVARQFTFGSADTRFLAEPNDDPIFAIRVLVDDDGTDLILHAVIPDPSEYSSVMQAWDQRGIAVNCIAASCYLSTAWQQHWLPTVLATPTIVLVDTGLMTMVGPGRLLGDTEVVHANYLDLAHPALKGLVWHVDEQPHVMLAVGDDLTIQLLAGQLTDLLADRLLMSASDWSQWSQALSAVTASLTQTDSFIGYDGTTAG